MGALQVQSSVDFEPVEQGRPGLSRAVTVAFEVTNLYGQATFAVELFSAGGLPYRRAEMKVTGEGARPARVALEVPVAGTLIEQAELYGSWEARLFHEGALLATRSFELSP